MITQIPVDVQDDTQRQAIERALQDPAFRAVAIVLGLLLPLGGPSRSRVMRWVVDELDERKA